MFTLIHNGSDVKIFKSINDVANYIDSILKSHKDLAPTEIYNRRAQNKHTIVYQYNTLYCEMFLIVKEI